MLSIPKGIVKIHLLKIFVREVSYNRKISFSRQVVIILIYLEVIFKAVYNLTYFARDNWRLHQLWTVIRFTDKLVYIRWKHLSNKISCIFTYTHTYIIAQLFGLLKNLKLFCAAKPSHCKSNSLLHVLRKQMMLRHPPVVHCTGKDQPELCFYPK